LGLTRLILAFSICCWDAVVDVVSVCASSGVEQAIVKKLSVSSRGSSLIIVLAYISFKFCTKRETVVET
jgi:hypothetical protein